MAAYSSTSLYEDAYRNKFNWEKWLPEDVYKYHQLLFKELNSPVELQMGVILPFISSIIGPKTRGLYSTRPSVLNLFWLNVACSGAGKSQARKRMISEPMRYLLQNTNATIEDFTVSKFTRAGIDDKIIHSDGYCCLVTDEGSTFFDDLKKKETKHESDIGLLNQLYDGEGDKTTLAQNKERVIPRNSTSLTVSLQPEPYITGLSNLGSTLWNDNGFGERFLVTAVTPYRFSSKENREAYKEWSLKYDENIMGKVVTEIFNIHKDIETTYELDEEAQDLYEAIVDKFNSQFNLKYSTGDISSSQPKLDDMEKSEILVRTKARELIGRLSIVLWIYSQAFHSVHTTGICKIPKKVSKEFVGYAEEIVNTSYIHSETFSSAVMAKQTNLSSSLCRPRISERSRIISALVRSNGPVANVRSVSKNLRNMTTEYVKDELIRLTELGYGKLVMKDEMYKDGVLPYNQCCTVFMKPSMDVIDKKFLDMCSDKEINETTYSAFFSKPIDDVMKKIVKKYHPDRRCIFISQGLLNELDDLTSESDSSSGNVFAQIRSPKIALFKKVNRPKTALSLLMEEEKENIKESSKGNSTEEQVCDDTDVEKRNNAKPHESQKAGASKSQRFGSGTEELFDTHMSMSDMDSTDSGKPKVVIPQYKGKEQLYVKSKKGRKFHPVKGDCDNSDIIKDTSASDKDSKCVKGKGSKRKFTRKDVLQSQTNNMSSTDDSDAERVHTIPETCPVSSGKSKEKTQRWNRPKRIKEVKHIPQQPTRKSNRIQNLKNKMQNDKGSVSSDMSESTKMTQKSSRKRRLSKSKRDEIHNKKSRRN